MSSIACQKNDSSLSRRHFGLRFCFTALLWIMAAMGSEAFGQHAEERVDSTAEYGTAVLTTVIFQEPVYAATPSRPFYMNLKSNLIYDALALPSVGAEFYVGKNWSVGINWTYGWWSKNDRHRYWRAYGGDLNVRRWFGRQADEKPLTGHHIGAYGGVVTYDFEFGGKGYMGGLPHKTLWSRCNYLCGIEYGYTLPVSRRINFDFTIGVGYLGGEYLEYTPQDNHYVWQATKRFHWFGPTKAEISLVWLIGNDNYNRKGGLK